MEKNSSSDASVEKTDCKPRPFVCDVCLKSFSRRYHLNRHSKIHSANKMPSSQVCREKLKNSDDLKVQVKVEIIELSADCSEKNVDSNTSGINEIVKHLDNDVPDKRLATKVPPKRTLLADDAEPLDCSLRGKSEESLLSEVAALSKRSDVCSRKKLNDREKSGTDREKSYKCDVCGKCFSQNYHLQCHKSEHTEKRFSCKLCKTKFLWKVSLSHHMRAHKGEKPFKCKICDKAFSAVSNLNRHLRIHANVKPYNCEMCNKSFLEKCRLTQHMKFHLAIRPYKCDLCMKSFTEKGPLEIHKRVHTGERPFICDKCGKGFPRRSRLNEHMRLHTGQKPHKCEVCNKEFSQKSYLRKHMKFHKGGKPHECEVCHRFFSRMDNLNVHKKIHSGDKPYECPSGCLKRFSAIRNLKIHQRIHAKHQLDFYLNSHLEVEQANKEFCETPESNTTGDDSNHDEVEHLICSPTIMF